MRPLDLIDMEQAGYAQAEGPRLLVRIPTDWPADGEKRIGYVGILRLVECTRELHWRRDVAPYADLDWLDSITKSVTADFARPVMADTQIACEYVVTWLRPRSYGLRVSIVNDEGGTLSQVDLVSVWVDPGMLRPVAPNERVTEALRRLTA
jgi:acyl-CoA thioesterase FadM